MHSSRKLYPTCLVVTVVLNSRSCACFLCLLRLSGHAKLKVRGERELSCNEELVGVRCLVFSRHSCWTWTCSEVRLTKLYSVLVRRRRLLQQRRWQVTLKGHFYLFYHFILQHKISILFALVCYETLLILFLFLTHSYLAGQILYSPIQWWIHPSHTYGFQFRWELLRI